MENDFKNIDDFFKDSLENYNADSSRNLWKLMSRRLYLNRQSEKPAIKPVMEKIAGQSINTIPLYKRRWFVYAVAASIALFIVLSVTLFRTGHDNGDQQVPEYTESDRVNIPEKSHNETGVNPDDSYTDNNQKFDNLESIDNKKLNELNGNNDEVIPKPIDNSNINNYVAKTEKSENSNNSVQENVLAVNNHETNDVNNFVTQSPEVTESSNNVTSTAKVEENDNQSDSSKPNDTNAGQNSVVNHDSSSVEKSSADKDSTIENQNTQPASFNHTTETVILVEQEIELVFPNIFTPNNDGKNDYFMISNLEKCNSNHLAVTNRRGGIVYEKVNYQNNWDGGSAPDGVYYYILLYKTPKGEFTKRGTIHIYRR